MQEEGLQQIPCPRVKRILMNFQHSAERSLNGPNQLTNSGESFRHSTAEDARRKNHNVVINSVTPIAAPHRTETPLHTRRTTDTDAVAVSLSSKQTHDTQVQFVNRHDPANHSTPLEFHHPLFMVADGVTSCELSETKLEGETIACFHIGGENRLCLPQVINKVLFNIFEVKNNKVINDVSDVLHIFFGECNSSQLDALKGSGVLPRSTARSGLVLQTDAERLCAAFLHDFLEHRTARPEGTSYIPVAHESFGGCLGRVWIDEYETATSWCVECVECNGCMSPAEFVAHSHGGQENRTCHWGFNSQNWRSYLMLSEDADRVGNMAELQKKLDDMKLKFAGKEDSVHTQHKELIGAKKSRIQPTKDAVSPGSRRPFAQTNDHWNPSNIYKTWAACFAAVKKLQETPSKDGLTVPPFLFTGKDPVLENPDAVVPFEDAYRYDRNFAPNVTLSTAPFDELNKLREPEEDCDDVASAVDSGVTTVLPWRRRSTHSASDAQTADTPDDNDDNESVSSDKLESVDADSNLAECDESDSQLSTNLQSQMDLIRAAIIASPQDEVSKKRLIKRFCELQSQQMNIVKSIDLAQFTLHQELSEVYSLHKTQCREAVMVKQEDDSKLARIRHDDAAKMREAALERHKLLQQIEALSNANNMSDQALMAAQYKQEAELWKQKLEESERVNRRLRQELAALHKSLPHNIISGGGAYAPATTAAFIVSPVGQNGEVKHKKVLSRATE